MNDRLRVRLGGTVAGRHRLALQSLPERWSVDDLRSEADVTVAATATEAMAAMASGYRAVVLANPSALTVTEIDALLAASGESATCLALSEFAARLKADPLITEEPWAIIDSVAEVDGPQALAVCLFEQLQALRLLLGDIGQVTAIVMTSSHYVASVATVDPVAVTLTGVATGMGRHHIALDAVGAQRRLAIEVDLRAIAHPAAITSFDSHGARQSWPVHQSGLRLSYANLADALTQGAAPEWTLQRAAEDLRTIDRLFRASAH